MSNSTQKIKLGDEETSWEFIYKRNKVERMKREKDPLKITEELPEFIANGYESIPEDDIVRLYWHGIVHDKPKVGTFMIRLKVPCGIVTADQLRGVGRIAEKYGDNYSELTTRMGIQLHKVKLKHLPDAVEEIQNTGLSNKGAEGDTVRNITGCPLAGIDPHEPFDVRPVIEEAHNYFSGNPDYSDLPRKLKFTISGCPLQCNGPEFHGIALLAVKKAGQNGFAVRSGGGLTSTTRIARDLGIFVPEEQALEVLKGLTDIWNEELKYRTSRSKSRIKFMLDDHGPEKVRHVLEKRLGQTFEDLKAPEPVHGDQSHLGLLPQKQEGLYALGYSIPQGWVMGDQLQELADTLDEVGGEARFTRFQNFILVNIPAERVEWIKKQVAEIGFSLDDDSKLFGHSMACTSHKYCNYSVAKTKEKADEIERKLVRRFGDDIADGLSIKMDGCPHACAQHWMADIGLQGTITRTEDGEKIEAYQLSVGGGTGSEASIGNILLRKVPTHETTDTIARLVEAWLEERLIYEEKDEDSGSLANAPYNFHRFCQQHTDQELKAIALDEEVGEIEAQHVTLHLTGSLTAYAGGIEQHRVRSVQARNVQRLLKSITRRFNRLKEEILLDEDEFYEQVNLLVNEKDSRELDGLETELEAGDEVFVQLVS
jgi:ferredoxin-nitrite reductase